MSTTPISFPSTQIPSNQTTVASTNSTNSTADPSGLANEETFLQLLVAQIKNQDPTQPTDGTQFLTQLAQFSQLEQLIGIKGDLDTSAKTPATTPTQVGG